MPILPWACTAEPIRKLTPRSDEAAEGGDEGEGGRAHHRRILLRQPQAVEREIAAEEAKKEEAADEEVQAAGYIEGPAETHPDTDRHAEEVQRQRTPAPERLRQRRRCKTPEHRADRQQPGAKGRQSRGLRRAVPRLAGERDDRGGFVHGCRPQTDDRDRHEGGVEQRAPPQVWLRIWRSGCARGIDAAAEVQRSDSRTRDSM